MRIYSLVWFQFWQSSSLVEERPLLPLPKHLHLESAISFWQGPTIAPFLKSLCSTLSLLSFFSGLRLPHQPVWKILIGRFAVGHLRLVPFSLLLLHLFLQWSLVSIVWSFVRDFCLTILFTKQAAQIKRLAHWFQFTHFSLVLLFFQLREQVQELIFTLLWAAITSPLEVLPFFLQRMVVISSQLLP